jgi:hypothetical protein
MAKPKKIESEPVNVDEIEEIKDEESETSTPERITEDSLEDEESETSKEINEAKKEVRETFGRKVAGMDMSTREIENIANKRERDVRMAWSKEPKVSIIIPLRPEEEGQKLTPLAYANINGVEVTFVKGEYVELPLSVAKLFADSEKQTSRAINQFLANDGDEEKEKALNIK